MPTRRPTMKDVAERAGVAVSTVSYVLNDSGPVAADRRVRVLEAVSALGYLPNESARNLKRRSVATVGLVVPDLVNQYFAMIAEGVEQAASEKDVLVVFCTPEATGDGESWNSRLLRSQRLDGLIYLSGAETRMEPLVELTRVGPVVLVDEKLPGFGLPCVVSQNRRGAREIAAHVTSLGHEQLAILSGPLELWTAEQRLSGYREAIAAAGLDPDTVPLLVGDYRMSSGEQLAAEILSRPAGERPTALICANDLMAIGALSYCRRAGLRVPEDVSVVGFDDLPFASLLTPGLTTVRQPAREMGVKAAKLLLGMVDGAEPASPPPSPVSLKIRESTGPLPAG
ncbi:LacI family DNA-binding transcriptional regulator [Streptomyces sp. NPDC005355]|uniref:LacI family DNA-binding transcriptional regulator n=1 Tax=Streptomyces sp. NPDC005355 TaxID=3157038 RepID=UPI0033A62E6A